VFLGHFGHQFGFWIVFGLQDSEVSGELAEF
jgi:hypothetical protein